ncbi:transmembrane signal receptor [Lithospermum erythrorhizon]|uniref:Transmembrane signal receptor n=1 Tax=Lithospermum erythrorhizon TaxID=34254 RepID=A0AAV3NXK0_LITER
MQILAKDNLLGGHEVKDFGFCEHRIFGKLHRSKFPKATHRTKGTLDYIHSDCGGPSRVDSLGGHKYFLSLIDDYSMMTWTGKKIKRLRTDNGLEFCSSEFDEFCKNEGIARHHTVRHTPQQNGVAERIYQTLLEMARCMLLNVGLERKFWTKAVNTSSLRAFGCIVYYHVNEGKLEPRAKKEVFVGYGDGVYRVWSPSKGRVILSRNVVFDENFMFNPILKTSISEDEDGAEKQVEQRTEVSCEMEVDVPQSHSKAEASDVPPSVAEEVDRHEPASYKEGVTGTESVQWPAAMGDEMESLQKNQTWELVRKPTGRKVVTCKWLFKKKEGLSPVEEIKYKARVVARGFSQRERVNYNEIFSHVVRHTSIRVLLAIFAHQELELEQLDVKTTFPHGELEEESYMTQQYGFQEPKKEDYVCRLKKSLYGLKQSPRQWYKKFDSYMLEIGYLRVHMLVVYTTTRSNGSFIYSVLYVDDLLLAAVNKSDMQKLKGLLSAKFDMKDLGAAKKILGMQIYRDRSQRKLFLSEKDYIEKILSRFGMASAKPIDTPSASNAHLSVTFTPKSSEEKEYMSCVPYASTVGSLMYAMALDLILHMLSVLLVGDSQCIIFGYSDSDYVGDVDSRRSMIGYVFILGVLLDQVHHERTKHIDVRYHFLRSEKRIKVNKVGTADNPVDMFTKPVPQSKFQHCLNLLNIQSC